MWLPSKQEPIGPLCNDSEPSSKPPVAEASAPPPLRSVFTQSFPPLLEQLGVSVLVTTYQAGKLVALRADGSNLNTHFRSFVKPMGLAVAGGRLALGTAREVWEYHNLPAVARRLEPAGKHDACFLPRRSHVTGDIHIHEMAWAGSQGSALRGQEAEAELWFVNTRFSCLCTRCDSCSFVPRWRPSFVTQLTPEDRCHLNGLGLRDGQPRYVTALGRTDTPAGWRERKKDGGILLDVASKEVLVRGLSMPHSPRWHDGRLWVLESGNGGIGVVDLATGKVQTVARLPGFTRGLDFAGRFAFVGLSQVRDSAVFSGIPIAERPVAERACGVWVVDTVSGQIVAFVKFEDAVQEIFGVQVLPGVRFPELINDDPQLLDSSFVLPDEALADVPAALRYDAGDLAPLKPQS